MDEFLQNLKTLRYQMNDVEDQAAKLSVEEEMQITTIQTLQKDLHSAKSETIRVKEDTDLMMKAKGQICSQILEKQRKIATLESDSCILSQTLELIQQEIVSLSAKFTEKRAYYEKVEEDMNTELLKQQEWIKSNKLRSKLGKHCQVESNISEQTTVMEAARGNCNSGSHLNTDKMDESEKSLTECFDAAKTNFDAVAQMKFNLVSEIRKDISEAPCQDISALLTVQHSIELVKSKIADYKPELQEMDNKSLEEEIQALLSDKAAETEYLQSLQNQIEILKGISHVVKCNCGVEYKIDLVAVY